MEGSLRNAEIYTPEKIIRLYSFMGIYRALTTCWKLFYSVSIRSKTMSLACMQLTFQPGGERVNSSRYKLEWVEITKFVNNLIYQNKIEQN